MPRRDDSEPTPMADNRSEQGNRNPHQSATGHAAPPHDLDAEASLLGAAMRAPEALDILIAETRPADYYRTSHQNLAAAMVTAAGEGWTPDPVTLLAELRRTGTAGTLTPSDLAAISRTGHPAAAGRYARIIHDLATLRRLANSGTAITRLAGGGDAHEAVAEALHLLEGVASQNGTRNLSTIHTADIPALLAGNLEMIEPDYLTRSDGQRLLYAGAMHVIQAEPESGKSWLALLAALEILDLGGAVVYLDYEDSAHGILRRLLALGADPAAVAERFRYLQPEGPFGAAEKAELGRHLDELNPDLVILDGVAEALARDGLDENSNSDVVGWTDRYPRWISRTGAAVVMLDHVAKTQDDRGSRYARGAGAKLAAIDGATYGLKVVRPFSRRQAGTIQITLQKDRNGGVGSRGEHVGTLNLTPHANGARVVLTLDPHTVDLAGTDPWKPTGLMEKVSRALEESSAPLTATSVRMLIHTDKKQILSEAIARLITEGNIRETTGKKRTLEVVRPYRADDKAAHHHGDPTDPGPTEPPMFDLDEEPSVDEPPGNVIHLHPDPGENPE